MKNEARSQDTEKQIQGRRAYEGGLPIDACPYPTGHVGRIDWMIGWLDARTWQRLAGIFRRHGIADDRPGSSKEENNAHRTNPPRWRVEVLTTPTDGAVLYAARGHVWIWHARLEQRNELMTNTGHSAADLEDPLNWLDAGFITQAVRRAWPDVAQLKAIAAAIRRLFRGR